MAWAMPAALRNWPPCIRDTGMFDPLTLPSESNSKVNVWKSLRIVNVPPSASSPAAGMAPIANTLRTRT